MTTPDLARAVAAAIGDDVVRELLTAAVGLATGDVRDLTLELAADRRPVLTARRVTKGPKLPWR